eukprot:scaffold1352_cov180-Amphora_coffeaeformis.AAC.2
MPGVHSYREKSRGVTFAWTVGRARRSFQKFTSLKGGAYHTILIVYHCTSGTIVMWKLLIGCACLLPQVFGASVYSSRAAMDLNLETPYRYSIASAFHAEELIAIYLRSIFNATDPDLDVLAINVQVKDEGSISGDRMALDTIVSMVYIANEPKMVANLLVERVDTDALAEQLQIPSLSAAYDNLLPTQNLQNIPDMDDGRPKADKGLIAITVFLSIALLLIASVVLYISGGWAAFTHCCINCLFEEIEEEDEYAVAKKSTFQVQSFDEGDNNGQEQEDNRSVAESQAPSEVTEDPNLSNLPEGLLGAMHHPNPAAGLGIKTPNRADTSGYDSEMNSTPLSEMTQDNNHGPLGITSMRKMPIMDQSVDGDTDDDIEGGLAHLILKRRFKESKRR